MTTMEIRSTFYVKKQSDYHVILNEIEYNILNYKYYKIALTINMG